MLNRFRFLNISVASLAFAALTFAGQDWYHERDTFFHGEGWHGHIFERVRNDIDHIYTAGAAAEREQRRLDRTKEELTALQAKLDQGVFDNGTINDVIDSLRKSANDQRLGPQDRQVLADDAARIHEFQRHHNEWMKH
jgi:hypothetical protein